MMTVDWSDMKYFSPTEFACQHCGKEGIDPELVYEMDRLRELFGLPITITSGYRCPDHPLTKDRQSSSHAIGLACDISIKSSRERYMLLDIIFTHDLFCRIGIGDNYLHLDLDKDKSQMLVWLN